jgi:hypothetical protein
VATIQRLMSTTVAASMFIIGGLAPQTMARGRESPGLRAAPSSRHRPARVAYFTRHASHARAGASSDDGTTTGTAPRIRVEDDRLAELIEYGRKRSTLFASLINRLNASDLVVYVQCDQTLRRGVAGKLSFVGMSAGIRYVQIRVGYVGDRLRQIALIGHELRHAVEVADTPAMVDRGSFDREYARLGYVNRLASGNGVTAFESEAAIASGEQILRELRNGTE